MVRRAAAGKLGVSFTMPDVSRINHLSQMCNRCNLFQSLSIELLPMLIKGMYIIFTEWECDSTVHGVMGSKINATVIIVQIRFDVIKCLLCETFTFFYYIELVKRYQNHCQTLNSFCPVAPNKNLLMIVSSFL